LQNAIFCSETEKNTSTAIAVLKKHCYYLAISSNLAADGRHQHAALVHAAGTAG
jgi:hypothetical protein